MDNIALGTAQFGIRYGVSNVSGQVSVDEIFTILEIARDKKINTLDTAIAYGEAETVLGQVNSADFSIITKLPSKPEGETDVRAWVSASIQGSLQRLKRESVDAVLLHRSQEIIGADWAAYQAALLELKDRGLCKAVGVSIYAPGDLDAIWQHSSCWRPDIVQAPYNILDRRMKTSGWMSRLQDNGIRLHTRSAFLQGLLLMPPENRPSYFSPYSETLSTWDEWCRCHGQTPLSAALGFVCQDRQIEKVVLGVDSARHLSEIIAAADRAVANAPDNLATENLALIDPSRWKTT